jgi:uncharacterized protein involved in exopolysaccharide biosynthesis
METTAPEGIKPEVVAVPYVDDEVSPIDLLILLAKHKRTILYIVLSCSIVAAGISLLIPNKYTAKTRIMPPQQSQSSLSLQMLSQVSSVLGLMGKDMGMKNPSELYVAMLKSRTVGDALNQRFDLKRIYRQERTSDTLEQLGAETKVTTGKDGTIGLEFTDRDPRRAAEIANAYMEELSKLTSRLAVTEASQRRLFFEMQLQKAREDLSEAEVAFRRAQEKTGLIEPESQARAIIESVALIRAQIAAKEVQISAMRSFATPDNPDLRRAEQELAGLQVQRQKLEKQNNAMPGDIQIPTTKIPEVGLEYLRKFRDLKFNETLYELITKQYELAKMDEAKDAAIIQVLDKAVPPDKKSGPKRTIIVIVTALAAAVLACLWVMMREFLQRLKTNPEQASKLELLKWHVFGSGLPFGLWRSDRRTRGSNVAGGGT